jgi:PKD repeat protein
MWPDTTFEVMYQDSALNLYHQYYIGDITATRHANGRDWWVITFDIFTPQYYAYLLEPEGIHLHHTGMVDVLIPNGLGQSVFSPLGNYLARVDAVSQNLGQYITLMSFDRCRGELVREHTFHTPTGTFTGAAFSSDERFLYADNNSRLWQWDLQAANISGSQFLVDTFDGFIQPGWFHMRFGPMMQAPDNRIYIVPPAGSSQFIHTIERPDQPGKACRFLQHNINLTKWNGRSSPNVPNFRLGPVDGSPCDTLGIDNHPVARWRYEELNPGFWQEILFTDMSYFDPNTWHWDFDDGTTSDERSPVHSFEPGLYHVCLTVSNDFASDSLCRWVDILSTSLEVPGTDRPSDLTIDPNPFTDALVIRSKSGIFRPVHMQLYNIHGQVVFDQPQAPVPVTIYLPGSIVPGMYFCRIVEEDGTAHGFKLVRW